MYELVERIDADLLYSSSRRAFEEMLAAGITAVGEFHYLHGEDDGGADRFDRAVLAAAADAGIRIVLLGAYYATGGIGQPLAGGQRRFATRDPAAYWARVERLADALAPATQSQGAVVHSIRAACLDELGTIHAEAMRRGLVFHMHVEEQERELEDCRVAYGAPPMALLVERMEVSERFTAVHCTHTAPRDMERFLAAGGNVCICPLTEANLGDGIADLPAILARGGRVSLGTDSNARISMLEEMRWLEYAQRLRLERRGVCVDGEGDVARVLLAAATANGARALGLDAGRIAAGALADFVVVDLDAPALRGASDDDLLATLVFGAGDETLAEVCVGGCWVATRWPRQSAPAP
jgi:formimidoylglutamate deiminase